MARPPAIEVSTGDRVVLHVRSLGLTGDQLLRLGSDKRDVRIEMSARRELIIMPPPGSKTGQRNAIIVYCLMTWTRQDGTGLCFGTDTGFTLPDGAKRAPDAAWIAHDRWKHVP